MAHVEKYERTLFTFEVNVEKLHMNEIRQSTE